MVPMQFRFDEISASSIHEYLPPHLQFRHIDSAVPVLAGLQRTLSTRVYSSRIRYAAKEHQPVHRWNHSHCCVAGKFDPFTPFAYGNAAWHVVHGHELLEAEGRKPQDVRRTVANTTIFGKDEQELKRKLDDGGYTDERLEKFGIIAGTGPQIVDQIGAYQEAGAERVMLQWLDIENQDALEGLAKAVL